MMTKMKLLLKLYLKKTKSYIAKYHLL